MRDPLVEKTTGFWVQFQIFQNKLQKLAKKLGICAKMDIFILSFSRFLVQFQILKKRFGLIGKSSLEGAKNRSPITASLRIAE